MNRKKIINVLDHVNKLLVEKKYKQLYEEDFLKDGNYDLLWRNIEDYGGQITMPPQKSLNNPKLLDIENNEAMIEFDLWIDGKKSDLTLSLLVIKKDNIYQFNIEEIHIQ